MRKGFNTSIEKESTAHLRSKELASAVIRIRRRRGRPSYSQWDYEFGQLEKVHSPTIVKAVLDWYIANIKTDGIPKAYAASSFRKYFRRYLTLMEREQEHSIPISEEAHLVVDYTGDLLWPDDQKDHELKFIQLSLDNFHHFRRCLKIHGTDKFNELTRPVPIPGKPRQYTQLAVAPELDYPGLLMYLEEYLADPELFITGWTFETHEMAWEWEGWSGNLLQYVWKVTSNRFKRMMTGRDSGVRELDDWQNSWARMTREINEDRKKERLRSTEDPDRDDH